MILKRALTLVVMTSAMWLAACGNDERQSDFKEIRSLVSERFKGGQQAPDAAASGANLEVVSKLAARVMPPGDPLTAIRFDSVGIATVLRQIETNGRHLTWAALGKTDRKYIVTKDGMIVATRGLVQDLMSAESDAVHALVRKRDEGDVPYTLRYIDGDYEIIEAKYTCTVSRGYDKVVELADGSVVPVLQMFSSCVSTDRQFVDLFLVDPSGDIVEMRQWVGPVLGFANMVRLRRP